MADVMPDEMPDKKPRWATWTVCIVILRTGDAGIRERPSKVKSSPRRRFQNGAFFESRCQEVITWQMSPMGGSTIGAGGGML